LPPISGGSGSLPALGKKGGAFEIDASYMKNAQRELDKLADFDQPAMPLKKDDRSMAEIMKAKREQTEAQIESSKQQPGGQESVEARKARLQAQRDILREHKKKQMAQELQEFNAKANDKDTLFKELKQIDSQAQKVPASNDEMEKRRQILKGVKATIEDPMGMSAKGSSILDDLEAFKV
jgi:acyl-CoA reductase-like NAD-dependent aldehyde dehydrogenase